METLTSTLLVFLMGIVELWLAVPVGLALKLNPFIIALASASGAIVAVVIVSNLGENIRERFLKWRYGENRDLINGRIYVIWNKYGLIGLGMLSPLLLGAPLGAALGIALGARKEKLVLWMTIGIVIWSAGLTVAGAMGLMSYETFIH